MRRELVVVRVPVWDSEVCITLQLWSRVGSIIRPLLSLLPGRLTSCQNCVPSHPGRQACCPTGTRTPTAFSFPSIRLLGKFQFLVIYCLNSLIIKGRVTPLLFIIPLFLPRLLYPVSSYFFWPLLLHTHAGYLRDCCTRVPLLGILFLQVLT